MQTLHPLPDWVCLEHQVAELLTQQEQHGWQFDTDSAERLAFELREDLRKTEEALRRKHPFVYGGSFIPKRDNRTSGYVKGAELSRLKELNPTSRDHIAWILEKIFIFVFKTNIDFKLFP